MDPGRTVLESEGVPLFGYLFIEWSGKGRIEKSSDYPGCRTIGHSYVYVTCAVSTVLGVCVSGGPFTFWRPQHVVLSGLG